MLKVQNILIFYYFCYYLIYGVFIYFIFVILGLLQYCDVVVLQVIIIFFVF